MNNNKNLTHIKSGDFILTSSETKVLSDFQKIQYMKFGSTQLHLFITHLYFFINLQEFNGFFVLWV